MAGLTSRSHSGYSFSMATTQTPTYRFIGTTDECTRCQCCGKNNLRSTVVLAVLDADGNEEIITYYGSSCAARALSIRGGGTYVRRAAGWASHKTIAAAADARRMLAHYGLPETGEPTAEQTWAAMKLYIARHPGIHDRVAESGIGVRERVTEMVTRYQAALAEARLLGDTRGCDCGACHRWTN